MCGVSWEDVDLPGLLPLKTYIMIIILHDKSKSAVNYIISIQMCLKKDVQLIYTICVF